jgi:hypothetical protein
MEFKTKEARMMMIRQLILSNQADIPFSQLFCCSKK